MKFRYLFVFFTLLLMACPVAYAQHASNVNAWQEGKTIIITYDLDEDAAISLTATANNGNLALRTKSLSGDVGKKVKAGKQKMIVWDVLNDYGDTFLHNDVVFTVKATPALKTFIMAEGSYSLTGQWGAGVMIGQVSQWGWFVKARSNYDFHKSAATAHKKGTLTKSNVMPFYSGKKASTLLMADAGIVVRLGCPLYAYVGAGLGMRNVYWQTLDRKWIKYSDNSIWGASADFGLMGCIKGFTISAGVNTIHFKYMEMELGLGWMF